MIKLLRIQLALSGRSCCPPHKHVEKILVQIKGATAYQQHLRFRAEVFGWSVGIGVFFAVLIFISMRFRR